MIEVGHKHNIPTDHILQRSIGGYNFTLFEDLNTALEFIGIIVNFKSFGLI